MKLSKRLQTFRIWSVGSKLFLTFFAGIVTFVAIVGGLSYLISKSIITDQAQSSFGQTIEKTGEMVSLSLDNVANASKKLAVNATLIDRVQSLAQSSDIAARTEWMTKIMEEFRGIKAESSMIARVSIVYEGGGVHSDGKGISADAYKAEWYEKAKQANGQPIWLAPEAGGQAFVKTNDNYKQPPSIALARLIRNTKSGADVGVAIFEVKMDSLAEKLQGVKGANLFIADGSNRYVYSGDEQDIGQPTGHDALVSGKTGSMLLSSYGLEASGWTLAGEIPLKELTKDTGRIALVTVLCAIGAAVFAAFIGWLIIRDVAKPVLAITRLLQAAANGDLTGRAKVTKRRDEIGQLNLLYNEMVSKMGQLISETVDSAGAVLETATSLEKASRGNSTSTSHIMHSTKEIEGGALQLAADAERGMGLAEAIEGNVRQVIDSNAEMEMRAGEVRRAGSEGREHLTRLTNTTGKVEQSTQALNAKLKQLESQTSTIAEIVQQLERQSKQTNILALNASIEASRAGAAGKGFQVIASEMSGLANESIAQLVKIGDWMRSMTEDIRGAAAEMNRAAPLFQEQFQAIATTESLFGEVNDRMEAFSGSLETATERIREMTTAQHSLQQTILNVVSVSEQSSASVQEVASMTAEQAEISDKLVGLAQGLEKLAEKLNNLLVRFRI
ncbi:methyl-accepting chemotaxis protein [Cohnella sp. AR92]|uniref:methyl-accepting chemotaxis protein n=1 Tax=Cohnella sp. AR92 TaxID=648716 RepID=UPI000F8DD4C2|nr:methyl-accepting chemotaxis protein [Cohnella sp. AR92]RUS45499.1 methyl-accepting chemotaxis protein [Cohnella sp. AR92]